MNSTINAGSFQKKVGNSFLRGGKVGGERADSKAAISGDQSELH